MTGFIVSSLMFTSGLAIVATSDPADFFPWIMGMVLSLAGFIGLLFKRTLDRQDAMHAENREAYGQRDAELSRREDLRTSLNEKSVAALNSILIELRELNRQHIDIKGMLDAIPEASAERTINRLLNQSLIIQKPPQL